jgi:hypothetical protein
VGGAERVGRNEAIFRHVNEKIVELSAAHESQTLEIVCECADHACAERLTIGARDYELARSEAATFIVAPGHVVEGSEEDVVLRTEAFWLVNKRGAAAEAAEEID